MIGAIIGDIVGSRFEFNNFRRTEFELFHPESRYTDDTVCTMAVADWVLQSASNSANVPFAPILQSWCRNYPMGDYGGRFRLWIENPIPYNSYGNGSAMRISPVADFFNDPEALFPSVDLVTSVSHNHSEGLKGANAVAHAIWMARSGSSKPQIKQAMTNFGYYLNSTCAKIRKTNTFNETCQVTVPQALICFLEATDFESAIRLAVSIGGDSDTIAAITCSIAEAYYGVPDWMRDEAMRRLPLEMQKLTVDFYQMLNQKNMMKEPIEELTDEMHATFTISDETDRKHRVWASMNIEATGDYSIEEALEMQQVTMADYELYKETYPTE